MRISVAVLACLLGVALMSSAMGLFRRTGQDRKPWKATPGIISTSASPECVLRILLVTRSIRAL
ncbi:MAG: hypothetical protein OEM05_02105 [Myxococcales bacterium]|nr:hypothetical protein [Myxococcales bacterium]